MKTFLFLGPSHTLDYHCCLALERNRFLKLFSSRHLVSVLIAHKSRHQHLQQITNNIVNIPFLEDVLAFTELVFVD